MGQLTGSKVVAAVRGLLSALDSTDDDLVKNLLLREKIEAHVTDGGTAGTAQTETFIWRNDTGVDMYVYSARFCTPVAVTANDTTYATFTLAKRDSAGANSATVGSMTTQITGGSGNVTAFLPVSLTLTAANRVVPAGSVLTIAVAKASTGVAIAAATSQVRIEVVLEPAG